MDEIIDYWMTRRGVRRGLIPNRTDLLWESYRRFVLEHFEGTVKPAHFREFSAYLVKRGYERTQTRTPSGRRPAVWLLNKCVVPRSSLR